MRQDFEEQLASYERTAKSALANDKRKAWMGFVAAAGAASVMASSVEAEIRSIVPGAIGIQVQNVPGSNPITDFAAVGVDLDGDGMGDLALRVGYVGGTAGIIAYADLFGYDYNGLAPNASGIFGYLSFANVFASGSPVSGPTTATGGLVRAVSTTVGYFFAGGPGSGIFGLQFVHDNATLGPTTVNAWLNVEVGLTPGRFGTGDLPFNIRILDGAFEDNGGPILAGQGPSAIPEPSDWAVGGLALLALGAAGVTRFRQLRSAST